MANGVPTRGQLLALKRGGTIVYDGMRARLPCYDALNPLANRAVYFYFSKHFLEGKLTYCATREFVEDSFVDPWELVSGELDLLAARQDAHHLDGSPVTTDD
jgi:hypothetical protein